jgi:endonuclease III
MHSLFITLKRRLNSTERNRAQSILRKLKKTFTDSTWARSSEDPFRTLVATIISQNTTSKNASKAFEQLSNKHEINPEALTKATTDQIEQQIKPAGLQKNKAEAIRQAAKTTLEEYHGDLKPILSLSIEEARNALKQFRGVGPKTADIVLLFSGKKPVIPVDTHVNRVSKRLGLAPKEGGYEAVRCSLQTLYDAKDYLAVHMLLVQHGRTYCKARKPLCKECPVNELCPSRHLWDEN